MKIPRPTCIDFETYAIMGRPDYPPAPVGVAIKPWGKKGKYYAWGHEGGGNNCTRDEAHRALREVWGDDSLLLMHHAKFDLDVAEVHFGLTLPSWERSHDSTFLLFLDDPHARAVDLKAAAEKHLGLPPEERDAVADWLVAHQPVPGVRITRSNFGAYIAYAPGDVVGPYALGDVVRTEGLFRHLFPSIADRGMLPAYDRERRLVPILLDMERRGIRVDVRRLRSDVDTYGKVLVKLEAWVRKRLDCGPEVNLDSGRQLVAALVEAGAADVSKMGLTAKKGEVRTDKAALAAGVSDAQLAGVLRYAAQLKTCLGTFMRPWLEVAERSGGLIFTNWNQIRGEKGGTRTGRFSSTPNFQNIPKEFGVIFEKGCKPPFKLPPLPLCRGYIVPYEPGHVLVGRDYSQQEPRIMAHFEDGALMQQYQDDPWLDVHDNAKEHLERIYNRPFQRRPVKNINLGLIYAEGIAALALKNGESYDETKRLKESILAMYPGLRDMYKDMKMRAKTNQPLCTWGGREYFCEPPSIINNRVQEWDYKMVNVLIQGSAADCTKEAMIRIAERIKRMHNQGWLMLLQVHDEIVLSVPLKDLAAAQELVREEMESIEFDVKILSEGAWSAENWAAMKDFDKKGQLV